MRAKKSLGQNFLMHAQIAERIALGSGVGKEDTVLEIGPGTGMLTAPLLKAAGYVIAVEADGDLEGALRERFSQEIAKELLSLVVGDIRTYDPSVIGKPYAVVANIPYYITGEIIRQFLSGTHKPTSMTLLVQKEVAERIAREPKGSILSIAVRAYGKPSYLFTVPRGAFVPAPNVDSAVLHIAEIHDLFGSPEAEARFFTVLKAGFAHKRKRLAKNLEAVATPERIAGVFGALSLSTDVRAEELSVDEWSSLAKLIAS